MSIEIEQDECDCDEGERVEYVLSEVTHLMRTSAVYLPKVLKC